MATWTTKLFDVTTVECPAERVSVEPLGDVDVAFHRCKVPDLESGNMLAKQLAYLAAAESAGIALGTRVPIALTSRADNARSREASTAIMALVAHAHRSGAEA